MKKIILTTLLIFISNNFTAQSITPKREFRGIWIASVTNLDWPTSNSLSTDQQKSDLIRLLDKIENTNINAVIFQIRPECDALYASSYEPWSYWLTGVQGKAPSPYYDPLEFAINESHKRGLEFHAWFNPYRAERQVNNYTTAVNHVTKMHPEWNLQIGTLKFLNPGLPQVREYVTNVVMDVVNRYDIDGVHFDDYFYPYPPNQITTEDYQTFADYPRGFTNIDDWRRDNVNELLRMIHTAIQSVKPNVKFGMSPFGIYKNGVPDGISGLDAYSTIYCDPIKWLNEKIIDYLTPQLYWRFGGGQDYGKLLPWWAAQVGDRHLIPGQALYRAADFPENEIPRQIRLNRSTDNVYGEIFFRAQNLFSNTKGVIDSLNNDYFHNKALIPQMAWKDNIPPNSPVNLRFEPLTDIRGDGIIWDTPEISSDGDLASMYVVYQIDNLNIQPNDLENPENIWKVLNTNYTTLDASDKISDKMYFTATALDKNNNESSPSNIIEVSVNLPDKPILFAPLNNAINQKDTTILVWNNSNHSSFNKLQIATDSSFNEIFYEDYGIIDTFKAITGLDGFKKYLWKVSAINIAGESEYSDIWSFSTGFPIPPVLLAPEDKSTEIPLGPILTWQSTSTATGYQIQVAEGLSIEPSIIIFDTLTTDTSITLTKLNPNKIFSWHVRAKNEFGFSKWSDIFKFKTQLVSGLESEPTLLAMNLKQNYPNPFNPETKIEFSILESSFVSLKIYDILGREVTTLVNEFLKSGEYSVLFDISSINNKIASGVYIYTLTNGKNVIRKKMMLLQ